jgi:hypothetical protein
MVLEESGRKMLLETVLSINISTYFNSKRVKVGYIELYLSLYDIFVRDGFHN